MATTTAPKKGTRTSTPEKGTTALGELLAGQITGRSVADGVETVVYDIKLPAPSFTTFALHLKGATSLIVDAFSLARKLKFASTQDGSAKVKPGPRDPEAEYQEALYKRADGTYGMPKLAFRKAIQSAAIRMTEIKGTEVLAAFVIDSPDEFLALDTGDPGSEGPKEFQRRMDHVVRVGRGNMSYRPEFPEWGLWLPIKLDHEVVTLDQFIHVVNKAGMGVGIGNWRPEKKGDFGTWVINDISPVTRTTRIATGL